jgi:UDP-2,3-diacylglucosamine pyrophosphatase LpxH
MLSIADQPLRRYRALFLSDIHLGTKNCQADLLLDFLARHDAPTIYLVGDIVDFWRIKRGAHWPQAHNDVVQALLRRVRQGTRIVYLPGNHDEVLRAYCGQTFGGIEVEDTTVHLAADGRRVLVMHGDRFDVVVHYAKWLALLGDWAYTAAIWSNGYLNWVRRRAGLQYWSLSAFLKRKVKQAVNFIGEFENALVAEARRQNADVVVCGHIHHLAKREVDGVLYLNTGDWVESGTAIGETEDGQFELIRWLEEVEAGKQQQRQQQRLRAAA